MGDVNNIRGIFGAEALKTKEQLLDRLTAAGAPNAAYHCSGDLVWVCPFYVREQDAVRLLDLLATTNKKLRDMPTEELGQFCHTRQAPVAAKAAKPTTP